MKKIAVTLFLFSFFIIESQAQYTDNGTSGSFSSDIVDFSWYLSGSTIYYSIDVVSPGTFYNSLDPTGRDNSVWFICTSSSGAVYTFEIIYSSVTLPYGPANYNDSFSISGYDAQSLEFSAGASFMTDEETVDIQSTPFGITL